VDASERAAHALPYTRDRSRKQVQQKPAAAGADDCDELPKL
jgi:hypothetical protein